MLGKKLAQKPEIGMVVDKRGISVVSLNNGSGSLQLQHFDGDDWPAVKLWVQEIKPDSNLVHLVLDKKQYQLHQVEPPKVPDAEMNQALLYSLRDRLDFPITELQIDHFEFPKDARRGGEHKINVVTSHTPELKIIIEGMEQSGLKPAIIDIAELAIGNILIDRESMSKGVCFLAYQEKNVTFIIYRNSELYLSRSVLINSWDDCVSPDTDFAKESLLLEIQRTFDYYQSQLTQPPVAELLIPDWGDPLSPLIDYLSQNLQMEVNSISFREECQQINSNLALRQLMIASSALKQEMQNAED
jgi:MSHA biogenesis protein MshI